MVRRKRNNSCFDLPTSLPSSHQSASSALTPAEKLSRADDLMSDVLDSCLWPTGSSALPKRTIKFTSAYRRPRALNMNDIKQIIHSVQSGKLKNISEATSLIRQLPAVGSYMANAEPPRLGKHMGLYLQLFLPKCGIRFCETDRYDQRRPSLGSKTLDEQGSASDLGAPNAGPGESQRPGGKRRKRQARFQSRELRDLLSSSDLSRCSSSSTLASGCSEEPYLAVNSRIHLAVFATRAYLPHELVAGCEGSFADLTEQEDLKLRSAAHLPICAARERTGQPTSGDDTDFSHIVNSRGKFQVFCGPARFVNHDCSNNVELLREGFTIKFKVIRPIKAGEEILTSYGANYFGERNCECMCATCERTGRGFYSAEPAGAARMKRESEEPSAHAEPSTDTDLSSLVDSSEASPAGDSPVSTLANTPPHVRRHLGASLALLPQQPAAEARQPASRSSSTRRQQGRTQEEPSAVQSAYVSRVKFLPTTDLTLPLLAPSRDASVAATAPSQPDGAGVQPLEPLPVKRKTYWITTKQKQLGLVPWEPESGHAYAPLAPSLLGPCKRRSTGSPASGTPSVAVAADRAPRLPMRSYWISTKQKQLGIVPWEPAPPAESVPKPPSPASTRATRAARKAAAGVKACALPPTAPRGRRLSFRVFDEGTEEAALLDTPIGRELFGFRPRGRHSRDSGELKLGATEAGRPVIKAGGTDADVKCEQDKPGSLGGSKQSGCQQKEEEEEEIDMLDDELSSCSGSGEDELVVTDKARQGGGVVSKGQAWTGLEWTTGKPVGGGTGGGGPNPTSGGPASAAAAAGGTGSSSAIEVVESSRRVLVSSVG